MVLYQIIDALLTLVHLAVIGFNLLGWLWTSTRRWHLLAIGLTAASWGILGIWYGFGYCPITDWQWDIKGKLGEDNLPNSFIKYIVDEATGIDVASGIIDVVTGVAFALAIIVSIWVNFRSTYLNTQTDLARSNASKNRYGE